MELVFLLSPESHLLSFLFALIQLSAGTVIFLMLRACMFVNFSSFFYFLSFITSLFLQLGVEVSVEEIEQTVSEVFEENKNVILEQRYRTNGK